MEAFKTLYKTFWGTTKKCENKDLNEIFSLRLGSVRKSKGYLLIYVLKGSLPNEQIPT